MKDPTNAERAERANFALEAYREKRHDEPDESDLRDLMCDCLHLMQSIGLSPREELSMAATSWALEADQQFAPLAQVIAAFPREKVLTALGSGIRGIDELKESYVPADYETLGEFNLSQQGWARDAEVLSAIVDLVSKGGTNGSQH